MIEINRKLSIAIKQLGNKDRADFILRVIQAAPVFSEWVNELHEDELYNAVSHIIAALSVEPKLVIEESKEGTERRIRNKPHAVSALKSIQKLKQSLGEIDNSAAPELCAGIIEIESHIQRIFIDKGDRIQKNGWQDWARFVLAQLEAVKYRKTKFSKPLELSETDWVLIIQAAIGEHVSRDAVKNWIAREKVTVKSRK